MTIELPDDAPEGLPHDPWSDPDAPHAGSLDQARALRQALVSLESIEAVVAATGVLTDNEAHLIVLEMALAALVERRKGQ